MVEEDSNDSIHAPDFDVVKTTNYWSEGAVYDLETGKSLIETKRYPYALFFGHLALEKILKAHVVKASKMHAPYTHSLPLLAQRSGLHIPEAYFDRLSEFMEFHIESRYPDATKAFYKKCTDHYTKTRMKEIEEIFLWLKNQL